MRFVNVAFVRLRKDRNRQRNDESRVVLGSNTGFHHLPVKEQRKLTVRISISL